MAGIDMGSIENSRRFGGKRLLGSRTWMAGGMLVAALAASMPAQAARPFVSGEFNAVSLIGKQDPGYFFGSGSQASDYRFFEDGAGELVSAGGLHTFVWKAREKDVRVTFKPSVKRAYVALYECNDGTSELLEEATHFDGFRFALPGDTGIRRVERFRVTLESCKDGTTFFDPFTYTTEVEQTDLSSVASLPIDEAFVAGKSVVLSTVRTDTDPAGVNAAIFRFDSDGVGVTDSKKFAWRISEGELRVTLVDGTRLSVRLLEKFDDYGYYALFRYSGAQGEHVFQGPVVVKDPGYRLSASRTPGSYYQFGIGDSSVAVYDENGNYLELYEKPGHKPIPGIKGFRIDYGTDGTSGQFFDRAVRGSDGKLRSVGGVPTTSAQVGNRTWRLESGAIVQDRPDDEGIVIERRTQAPVARSGERVYFLESRQFDSDGTGVKLETPASFVALRFYDFVPFPAPFARAREESSGILVPETRTSRGSRVQPY